MDKLQADAVARALLEPDPAIQDDLRRRRAAEARRTADLRLEAWFMLAGFAIGAVIAHFTGERFTAGGLGGSVAGGAVGWVVVAWRKRQGLAREPEGRKSSRTGSARRS